MDTLNKRRIYLTILLYFSIFQVKSSYYYFKTEPSKYYKIKDFSFLPYDLNINFLDSLNKVYNNEGKSYNLFKTSKGYIMHVRCDLDLYEVSPSGIKNLYKYSNHGYLCNSVIFEKNGNIYAQGGYGFWTYHSDLLIFKEDEGSWEFVPTLNQPLNFSGKSMVLDSGIMVLFGSYKNPRTNKEQSEENGWYLDWESKEWQKVKIQLDKFDLKDFKSDIIIKHSFHLKDFVVFGSDPVDLTKRGFYVLDKNTFEIYFLKSDKKLDQFYSPYIQVIDNLIYFQDTKGDNRILDFNELILKAKKIGQIQKINTGQYTPLLRYSYFLLLIPLLLIPLVRNLKKNKAFGAEAQISEEENEAVHNIDIWDKLKPYSGQTLDIESLDNLFEINTIQNIDNRRARRSRIISTLNMKYKNLYSDDLITRKKMNDDKRFNYYLIGLFEEGKNKKL
jgi:hypothetical protein